MNRSRLYTWGIVGLLLLAALLWAFWPRAVPVDTVSVTRGAMAVSITDEGEVRIHDVYTITAPTSGHLQRIDIEPGDCTRAQETILAELQSAAAPTLDRRTRDQLSANVAIARAAVTVAEADITARQTALSRANADLMRTRTLARSRTVSPQALERVQAEVNELRAMLNAAVARRDAARSDVRRARAALQPSAAVADGDRVAIMAPINGVVLRVMRDSEGPVPAGTPLLALGDPGAIEVVADILSEEAVTIRAGDRVRIHSWGGPPLKGAVERIEPFAFTKVSALGIEEQRTNVIIRLADTPAVLGHGYRVRVDIEEWATTDTLLAPMTAIFKTGTHWTTYRIEKGRARLIPLQVGHMNGQQAEILDGVSEGDVLIAHPSARIRDAQRVKARTSDGPRFDAANLPATDLAPAPAFNTAPACGDVIN